MDVCGKTLVRQVGIPEALLDASERVMEESGPVWPERFLPERRPSANKGNFGRLLCLCGSRGMAGAAVMAAGAALRSGAGIVDVALPESIYPIVSSRVTEPVFTLLPEENERVVEAFLRSRPGFVLEDQRTYTGQEDTDGFFVAALSRRED